jgi:protein SCO1
MALRFGGLQSAILADAALARRARLLSVTHDPEFDRPGHSESLWRGRRRKSRGVGICHGHENEIAALTKAFAVYNERNGVTLDHTLCTALIGTDRRIIEIWRGNGFRTNEVLAKLREENAKILAARCCHDAR